MRGPLLVPPIGTAPLWSARPLGLVFGLPFISLVDFPTTVSSTLTVWYLVCNCLRLVLHVVTLLCRMLGLARGVLVPCLGLLPVIVAFPCLFSSRCSWPSMIEELIFRLVVVRCDATLLDVISSMVLCPGLLGIG